MKLLLPASKVLLIFTLQTCLTSCEQDSKLDISSPEELTFREKVTDDIYCYMLSASSGTAHVSQVTFKLVMI